MEVVGMRFDTLLKMGSYLADIWKHESFQQMSKLVHKGVKRRMQYNDRSLNENSLYKGPFGPNFQNRNIRIPDSAKQPRRSKINWEQYVTPDNIQSVMQLQKTIRNIMSKK
jgi:hypothetical protein